MNDAINPTPSPSAGDGADDNAALQRRIVELEAALARMSRQREESRRMLFALQSVAFPEDRPPTEEELLEERKTLVEKTISELIAELVGAPGADRP